MTHVAPSLALLTAPSVVSTRLARMIPSHARRPIVLRPANYHVEMVAKGDRSTSILLDHNDKAGAPRPVARASRSWWSTEKACAFRVEAGRRHKHCPEKRSSAFRLQPRASSRLPTARVNGPGAVQLDRAFAASAEKRPGMAVCGQGTRRLPPCLDLCAALSLGTSLERIRSGCGRFRGTWPAPRRGGGGARDVDCRGDGPARIEATDERAAAGLSAARHLHRRRAGHRPGAADRALPRRLQAARSGKALGLRMRLQRLRRRAHEIRRALLPGRDPVHHLRSRSGVPVSLGGGLRRDRRRSASGR